MIYNYTFENFYSFLEETEVSLLANKQVPDSNQLVRLNDNVRLAKVMTVLGHNASGKTTLLKPLAFITWFMGQSFKGLAPEEGIPFETHKAADSDVMTCELEFSIPDFNDNKPLRYELSLSKSMVYREALFIKDTRYKYVFIREWDQEHQQYNIKQQDFGFKASEAQKVRKNASLIATAAQYDNPVALLLAHFSFTVITNVTMTGKRTLDEDILDESTSFYYNNESFLERLNNQVKKLDFGIDNFDIQKVGLPSGEEQLFPVCIHQNKEHKFALSLYEESSGTLGVYSMLRLILPTLDMGGVAVLDEMESELHPQMVVEIMKMFTDPESNPNNAQLIIATHSLEVLQHVEKNQIYLVEKNDCMSESWRLDEMKGIRRDENIYARYLAGAYGAVPKFD